MDLFVLILRLILAGVFFTAAIAKAADLAGSKRSLEGYGVPKGAAGLLSYWLIALEVLLGLGFLITPLAWGAAAAAVVVLAVFTGFLAYQLIRGNRQNCHCFGQLMSEPTGPSAIARNLVLIAAAAFLASRGSMSQGLAYSEVSRIDAAIILEVAILAAILICFAVIRRMLLDANAEASWEPSDAVTEVERDSGALSDTLPIGAEAPRFTLRSADGETVSLESLVDEAYPILLFFVGLTCGPCAAMLEDLHRWHEEFRGKLNVVFLSSGDAAENAAKFGDAGELVLLQEAREVADAYFARWTPSLVVIGPHGTIASHVAAGDAAIRNLIERVRRTDLYQPFAQLPIAGSSRSNFIGEPAPEIAVSTGSREDAIVVPAKGKKTLVLFWGAHCPHCEGMHQDVLDWLAERDESDPELVIFTDDDPLEKFSAARVIADPDYIEARKFGMYGTPSAVLIDENGRFASETAVGPASIWALLGRHNVH